MRTASITLPTTPKKAATGSILEASHDSTPLRFTNTKATQEATVKDVEPQIKHDVDHSTNWGIDANQFLRIVLNLKNDDEYEPVRENIEAAVLNVKADEKYRDQLKDFTNAVDGDKRFAGTEKKMYEPFVKMGNMLLEELEKGDTNDAKKIRLCYNNEKTVRQKQPRRGPVIKPDVLLVPETVEQGRKNMENIHIEQVLSPFEFKLKKNSARKEDAEEESCADATSVKASVDEVSARMASMISSAVASTDTASTGMKRKKRDIATNGSHKSMKGREGDTANSASRAYSRRDDSDTDPHGQRQLARYAAAVMSERGGNVINFCEQSKRFTLQLLMFQQGISSCRFDARTDSKELNTIIARLEDELVSEYEGYDRNGIYGDLVIVKRKAAEYGIVRGGCSAFKAACSLNQTVYTGKKFRILAMQHYSTLSEADNIDTFWDFNLQLVACESCILYAYQTRS